MHTAEEVRTKTNHLRGLFGQHELREMLLAYADLLDKRETEQRELSSARSEVEMLRAALEPFLKALENSGAATRKEEGARVQIEKEKNAND